MSISTHVLDAAVGSPAVGVAVVLEREAAGGEWTLIANRITDADGRIPDLATESDPGVYRLRFDVTGYAGPEAFYPEVVVVFRVSATRHHHVPLLLSPYSYSTYLGS